MEHALAPGAPGAAPGSERARGRGAHPVAEGCSGALRKEDGIYFPNHFVHGFQGDLELLGEVCGPPHR